MATEVGTIKEDQHKAVMYESILLLTEFSTLPYEQPLPGQCACACVRVCACVRACVRVCVCACVRL